MSRDNENELRKEDNVFYEETPKSMPADAEDERVAGRILSRWDVRIKEEDDDRMRINGERGKEITGIVLRHYTRRSRMQLDDDRTEEQEIENQPRHYEFKDKELELRNEEPDDHPEEDLPKMDNEAESQSKSTEHIFGTHLRHVEPPSRTIECAVTASSKDYAHDFGVKLKHVETSLEEAEDISKDHGHDFGVQLKHYIDSREGRTPEVTEIEWEDQQLHHVSICETTSSEVKSYEHDFGVKLKPVDSAPRPSPVMSSAERNNLDNKSELARPTTKPEAMGLSELDVDPELDQHSDFHSVQQLEQQSACATTFQGSDLANQPLDVETEHAKQVQGQQGLRGRRRRRRRRRHRPSSRVGSESKEFAEVPQPQPRLPDDRN